MDSVWKPSERSFGTTTVVVVLVQSLYSLQFPRSWKRTVAVVRSSHSTIDALDYVEGYISGPKSVGQYTNLITFDIKKVVNSSGRTDLLRLLAEYSNPLDLLDLIDFFRIFFVSNADEYFFNFGVPEGSCLGPTL